MQIKDFKFNRNSIKDLKPQFTQVTVNNKTTTTPESIIVNLSLVLIDIYSMIKSERTVMSDE